jgi:hypothetical protein
MKLFFKNLGWVLFFPILILFGVYCIEELGKMFGPGTGIICYLIFLVISLAGFMTWVETKESK